MGALDHVTVGVSDTEAALRLYRDVFGLRIERESVLTPAQLAAWGLTPGTEARLTELSCAGYPVGRLRLLETDAEAAHVRQDVAGGPDDPCDIGPKALDFYPPSTVAAAVEQMEAAGFPARSRPVEHAEGGLVSHELLFTGPDGVGVLVMEGSHGDLWRERTDGGYSEISTLAVIGEEPEATRRFYVDGLGLTCAVDVEPDAEATDLVCEIAGIPTGTRLHLTLFREPGQPSGKVLVVHPLGAAGERLVGRMRPGNIGLALATMTVDDLDATVARLTAPVERTPRQVDGRRSALVRGPNEELFELVERA